ncbi:MAG: hypothetical protein ACJ789_16935 [Thermomicrobiales bacterium]
MYTDQSNLLLVLRPGQSSTTRKAAYCVQNPSSPRRASGNLLEVDVNEFGRHALFYDGIPIVVNDFISDTQVQGTSGPVCSSVYAVKVGTSGVKGL